MSGADDPSVDGDQTYTVATDAAQNAGLDYQGLDAGDVSVTNVDDDVPGGLVTTEAGGTASFTVALNTRPAADVTTGFSSSGPTEGTVSPSSLTFTADDWSDPQTATVRDVDDSTADGSRAYMVVSSPAVSSDTDYGGMNPMGVVVFNLDDEALAATKTDYTVAVRTGGTLWT